MAKEKTEKSRACWFILYPDSAKENYQQIITDLGIMAVVSPLHDQDIFENGKPKKPHYHVIFISDGPKSVNQWVKMVKYIGGVIPMDYNTLPESVDTLKFLCGDIKRCVRYLVHADDKDKAQYCRDDIIVFGGYDVDSCFETDALNLQIFAEIMTYCDEKNVIDIYSLIKFAQYHNNVWFKYIYGNYGRVNCMLRARYQKVCDNAAATNNMDPEEYRVYKEKIAESNFNDNLKLYEDFKSNN